MRLVGVDLGTTKVAALLFDATAGRVLRAVSVAHEANLAARYSWEGIQDPARIARVADELISELSSSDGRLDALCITGQMHGGLYLDINLTPVSPLFTWLDARAAELLPSGGSYATELSRHSGYRVAPGFAAATHYYNLRNRLVPTEAVWLSSLMDWYAARLCGLREPVTDATIAASFGLFDLAALSRNEGAWSDMGSPRMRLPPVRPAGSLVGHDRTGLPVYLPLGDNQASLIGAVRDLERAPLINVGTGGQVTAYSARMIASEGELDARPFPGGGIILVGATLASGGAYAMLEAFFREVIAELGGERVEEPLFEVMNRIASAVPPGRELIVDTRFKGTRSDPSVSGSIRGITPDRFHPAQLVAGVVSGIASELAALLAGLRAQATGQWEYAAAAGNGLRRNPLLRDRLERASGLPLRFPAEREEAALGAALCAGVGAGVYADFPAAARSVHYEE